jgi:hypothetical protein
MAGVIKNFNKNICGPKIFQSLYFSQNNVLRNALLAFWSAFSECFEVRRFFLSVFD